MRTLFLLARSSRNDQTNLLSGEKKKERQVKCWFKAVNGLGDAGNSILDRGLQGSPLFETSESFFHKLESAIQSGEGGPRALHAPASQTREHFVALPDTNDVFRRFNCDTWWLATGVLGAVVFAALALAVLVQDRHPKALDLTEEAMQTGGDLLLIPSSQMEAAASTQTPVLTFTPEISRHDVQANAVSWTPAHRQDSGRVIERKVPRARSRSSVRSRFVGVKMRLMALWHQSLVRNDSSRSWTLFSNSNKGDRKKISYTAETNH
jgi:hypothetical protein